VAGCFEEDSNNLGFTQAAKVFIRRFDLDRCSNLPIHGFTMQFFGINICVHYTQVPKKHYFIYTHHQKVTMRSYRYCSNTYICPPNSMCIFYLLSTDSKQLHKVRCLIVAVKGLTEDPVFANLI
jgi:hypothetical protein